MRTFKSLLLRPVLAVAVCLTLAGHANGASRSYQRSVESYSMPDVTLINQDGKKVRFKELVESNRPLVVDFIFGTCTTICPVLSATYTNLQTKLGADMKKIHLVSVSIDPENDTPQVMREYLARYRAKPGWDFLSGSRRDIDRVMNAFNSYFRNKMDHKPLTFIRSPADGKWTRIYGLISNVELMNELTKAGLK
ncbi:SCO family protein [Geobacter anodireducens]|uniref:SCO family protein n=1 Tax=Geobacter anodireducens TaxID=1340425 RepID=A0ABR9NTN2_9BACT|nr:SCO family protein [Geobacter anodireducens]MBE2887627.1 SCO family protein [Geobacter anodireducens]